MGLTDLFKNRLVAIIAIPLAITAVTLLTDQVLKLAASAKSDDDDQPKPAKVHKTAVTLLVHDVEPDSTLSSIQDVASVDRVKPAPTPVTVVNPSVGLVDAPATNSATTITGDFAFRSSYRHSFVAAVPDSPSAPPRVFYDPQCQYLPTAQDNDLGFMARKRGQVPGGPANGFVSATPAPERTSLEEEDLGQFYDHENRPLSEVGAYSCAYLDATEVLISPGPTMEPPTSTYYRPIMIMDHILVISDPSGGFEDPVPSAGMEYTVGLVAIAQEQLHNSTPESASRALELMHECINEMCKESPTGTASVEDCEAMWYIISEEELVPRKTPKAKRSPKPATTSPSSPHTSFPIIETSKSTPASTSSPLSSVDQPSAPRVATTAPAESTGATFSFETPTIIPAEPVFSPTFGNPSTNRASTTRSDAVDVDGSSPPAVRDAAPPTAFVLGPQEPASVGNPTENTDLASSDTLTLDMPLATSPADVGASPVPSPANVGTPAIDFSDFKSTYACSGSAHRV